MTPSTLYAENEHLVYLTRKRWLPRVPSRVDRDDLHQALRIALWRAAERWEPTHGTAFRSYAIAQLRYAILEYLRETGGRRGNRRPEPISLDELVAADASFLDLHPDQRPGPAEEAEKSVLAETLREAVAALPAKFIRLLHAFYWRGEDVQTIAAATGLKPTTVYSRMSYARERLALALPASLSEVGDLPDTHAELQRRQRDRREAAR